MALLRHRLICTSVFRFFPEQGWSVDELVVDAPEAVTLESTKTDVAKRAMTARKCGEGGFGTNDV